MLAEAWKEVEETAGDSRETRFAFLMGANAALGKIVATLDVGNGIPAPAMAKALSDELKGMLSKL